MAGDAIYRQISFFSDRVGEALAGKARSFRRAGALTQGRANGVLQLYHKEIRFSSASTPVSPHLLRAAGQPLRPLQPSPSPCSRMVVSGWFLYEKAFSRIARRV
jgi:hypothetical protein